jgi:C-terminal processing protease CtpA/Prc
LSTSGRASAAGVFTAALQENGRGGQWLANKHLVKGIVQTILPLQNDNGGIAVTVAGRTYLLHHNINKQGIPVDVKASVERAKDDASACLPPSAFKRCQKYKYDAVTI